MSSDNSFHSDIESQMFKYSDLALESANKPVQEYYETPESQNSLFVQLVLKRTRHLKYNVAMAFLSGLKILATVAIIVQTPKACPDSLNYWLIAMATYDFLNVVSRFMLIKLLIPKKRKGGPIEGLPSEDVMSASTISQGKQVLIGDVEAAIILHEKREDKAVQAVAVTRFLYVGLFVWAQVVLYRYLRGNCMEPLNMRGALFYVFMAFGYAYIGIPLSIFILDCICTGFRGLKEWIKEKIEFRRQRTESTTEKMVIYRKFTFNLSGPHRCGICSNEYKDDENLIQLQCDINHHFHDYCLTDWMEKDTKCPLCNRKISYYQDNSEITEDSSRASVANIFL